MIQSVFQTLGSRMSVAGLNFLLVVLCARWFGAEGMGKINLLKTELALLVLVAGFCGTSSLAYLASRFPLRYLYQAAIGGAVLLAMAGIVLLSLYNPGLPESFFVILPILVFLLTMVQIQQGLLLGAGELNGHNLTGIVLAASQLMFVYWMVPGNSSQLPEDYARALRFSYSLTLIFSLVWLLKVWNTGTQNSLFESTKALYAYGFRAQLSNLVHFFNYRLTFYFLEYFSGNASLGKFSLGVSIAEAVWLISQSIATVQYMKVSRADNPEETIIPTIRFAWMSLGLAGLAVGGILILPESFFVRIFSEDFKESVPVLYWLFPGILAQSFSTQLAHYFSGRGMYGVNLWGSLIGVGMNAILGWLLIPSLGIQGAAITASVAYVVIMIWQSLMFKRISGASWRVFRPFTGWK